MRKTISPLVYNREFISLLASVKAARPAKEVRAAFIRLHQLHAATKFITATDGVQAGRNLGILKLLWSIRPSVCAGLAQAA